MVLMLTKTFVFLWLKKKFIIENKTWQNYGKRVLQLYTFIKIWRLLWIAHHENPMKMTNFLRTSQKYRTGRSTMPNRAAVCGAARRCDAHFAKFLPASSARPQRWWQKVRCDLHCYGKNWGSGSGFCLCLVSTSLFLLHDAFNTLTWHESWPPAYSCILTGVARAGITQWWKWGKKGIPV